MQRMTSGYGTFQTWRDVRRESVMRTEADLGRLLPLSNRLQTGQRLGKEIAGQKADAEQQYQTCGGEFDAAHDQCAAAVACSAQTARDAAGRYRQHRNRCDRDRGADAHCEGRGDAGPEQALRQREHQNQDSA